jgi:predicted Zn-ribbon and HTH transcriptional regulator
MSAKRKTHEEFIKEVKELVNEEYTVLEKYKSSSIKIKIRHNTCNNIYEVTPNKFLQGRRCPYCKSKAISKSLIRTQKEFEDIINNKFNGEYTVLGNYINNSVKLEIKHNKCKNTWMVSPTNILNNRSTCPYCSGKHKYTTKEYYNKIKNDTNGEYILISDYINNKTKVKIKHTVCNNTYEVKPYHFNNGTRCPYCSNHNTLTLENIKDIIENNFNYTVLPDTNYTGYKDKCLHLKHNLCNNDFMIDYDHFKQGTRCPKCNMSSGEEIIYNYLKENNLEFIREYTFNDLYDKDINKPLRFDFRVNLNNDYILIEFDGKQHFEKCWYDTDEDLKHRQYLDEKKNNYCIKHNIHLLRISYKEINNIDNILKEELKLND